MHLRIKMINCWLLFVLCLVTVTMVTSAQDTVESLATRVNAVERKVNNLARKNQHLTRELEETQQLLHKVHETKGILSDYPPCPSANGFNLMEDLGSCYKLYPSSVLVNSTEGERLCQTASTEAHLVSIDNQQEQDFLQAIWDNERGVSTISRYWTSGVVSNGNWRWAGERPIKFENWIATTSHNDNRFACLAVYSNEAYRWIDVACWSSHAVTCEIAR